MDIKYTINTRYFYIPLYIHKKVLIKINIYFKYTLIQNVCVYSYCLYFYSITKTIYNIDDCIYKIALIK